MAFAMTAAICLLSLELHASMSSSSIGIPFQIWRSGYLPPRPLWSSIRMGQTVGRVDEFAEGALQCHSLGGESGMWRQASSPIVWPASSRPACGMLSIEKPAHQISLLATPCPVVLARVNLAEDRGESELGNPGTGSVVGHLVSGA